MSSRLAPRASERGPFTYHRRFVMCLCILTGEIRQDLAPALAGKLAITEVP